MRWLIGLGLYLWLLVSPVQAVTVTITSFPSLISSLLDPFTVGVDISGPSPGTNYLRVDLYKEGTTNYFGETDNGSIWYNGSTGTQYFPVTISTQGTASAQISARMGSPGTTEYPGSGMYKLRIRRYTSSGNAASSDQQIPADVQITYTWPSPTPSPIPTPTPTSTPTSTPAPTTIPTITPKPTAAAQILAAKTEEADEATEEAMTIQTIDLAATETTTPSATPQSKKEGRGKWAGLMIVGGGGLAVAALFPFLRKWYYDPSWLKTLLKGGDRSSFGQE